MKSKLMFLPAVLSLILGFVGEAKATGIQCWRLLDGVSSKNREAAKRSKAIDLNIKELGNWVNRLSIESA